MVPPILAREFPLGLHPNTRCVAVGVILIRIAAGCRHSMRSHTGRPGHRIGIRPQHHRRDEVADRVVAVTLRVALAVHQGIRLRAQQPIQRIIREALTLWRSAEGGCVGDGQHVAGGIFRT